MKALGLIIILTILTGCGPSEEEKQKAAQGIGVISGSYYLEEQVIDSCEYLFCRFDRGALFTHKGNCKFCEERRAR